ncbi:MAG: hypothetical protein R2754_13765 [Microthrixaceae bacterium]
MTQHLLSPELRTLRVEVMRWALAHGRPLNRDAITIVLGTSRADAKAALRPERRFRTKDLAVFLHQMVPQYCERSGLVAPPHVAESMWTYLAFLADPATSASLAPRSSSAAALLAALSDVACLDGDGREVRPRRLARPAVRRVGGRANARRAGSAAAGSVTPLPHRARATTP